MVESGEDVLVTLYLDEMGNIPYHTSVEVFGKKPFLFCQS